MNRRQKTTFGNYLVEQIKKANISQQKFYNAVGIKKPYFYDLLTSTPPPINLQNRMLAVLDKQTGADPERRKLFYDLAATGRNEIPADIAKLISSHPTEFNKIRIALCQTLQQPIEGGNPQ